MDLVNLVTLLLSLIYFADLLFRMTFARSSFSCLIFLAHFLKDQISYQTVLRSAFYFMSAFILTFLMIQIGKIGRKA